LFRVSLSILDTNQPHIHWLRKPDLLVMELPTHLPVDVLIGMDILIDCRMLLDGPGGSFTLDY
jgi:hypothetical protein